jgi:hypothetical protein
MSSLAYSTAPVHLPIPGDAISGVEASAGPHSKEYESLARRRDLSSSSKMLLARIASYPQGHCFAKQATLALELGRSTKQIRRDVGKLTCQGLLKVERPIRRGPNHYTLIEKPDPSEAFTKHPQWLRQHPDLTTCEKRVLAYAYRRSGQGEYCQLNPKPVALDLGITPQHVRNVCQSLIEREFLDPSANGTHSYRLLRHDDITFPTPGKKMSPQPGPNPTLMTPAAK